MSGNKLDPESVSIIERRLEELKEVPARDPSQAARGLTRFLSEAATYRQAVSTRKEVRQRKWIFPIRKEKLAMNVLVTLILAASLIMGGGATVAAAQDDLPNQALYQLKLWTENASLAMNGDPQEQADLLMEMAQTRVQEMAALAEQGVTPPDQVRERLQQHLDQVIKLAAALDGPTRDQILLHLRDRLQTQDQIMEKLQLQANTDMEPLFTQTRQMLQTHLRLVDGSLADPQGFQSMMQNQSQNGQEEVAPEPNRQGEPGFHQNTTDEQPAVEPGTGNQNGYGPGNEPAGNQNQEQIQERNQDQNGGGGMGNESPGSPNPDSPGGGGNGGGGGNK